jgi:hypothetical protein
VSFSCRSPGFRINSGHKHEETDVKKSEHTTASLRDTLFGEMQKLIDGKRKIEEAREITRMANAIINTAWLEVEGARRNASPLRLA